MNFKVTFKEIKISVEPPEGYLKYFGVRLLKNACNGFHRLIWPISVF
jgi:hypothetical protein